MFPLPVVNFPGVLKFPPNDLNSILPAVVVKFSGVNTRSAPAQSWIDVVPAISPVRAAMLSWLAS